VAAGVERRDILLVVDGDDSACRRSPVLPVNLPLMRGLLLALGLPPAAPWPPPTALPTGLLRPVAAGLPGLPLQVSCSALALTATPSSTLRARDANSRLHLVSPTFSAAGLCALQEHHHHRQDVL
jgi:hypothetical protein